MTSETSPRPVSPLRARMIEDMTMRGFKEDTRRDYVRHVRAFAAFICRPPDTATPEDLRLFQLHQAVRRPRLEVADVFHRHGAAWRQANAGHVSLGQLQVMSAIEQCRSPALVGLQPTGLTRAGHVERREDCGHSRIAYNSCRNRHCPKPCLPKLLVGLPHF
jgi:hypothetical protein